MAFNYHRHLESNPIFKSYYHHKRCEIHPTYVPKYIWSKTKHLVDAFAKSIGSKKPRNSYCLEKTYPKQRNPRSRIYIHKLKYIHSTLKKKKTQTYFVAYIIIYHTYIIMCNSEYLKT